MSCCPKNFTRSGQRLDLVIPRLHKRGMSFKGACAYILHDPKTTSRERVQWTETCNLISKADDAWFEMFATARDQAALKEQSGHDARGRKNTKPVLHVSLSWALTDNPTPQHMQETAKAALNAMGLADHQAVIAAHGDKKHLHVHMVVNTIHPETGMTAPLKYTKERLSRWAEGYERAHGIHCEQRIENPKGLIEVARIQAVESIAAMTRVQTFPRRRMVRDNNCPPSVRQTKACTKRRDRRVERG